MIKVQHGWEHRNISELEQMNTRQDSPTSATSIKGQSRDRELRLLDPNPKARPVSAHSLDRSPRSARLLSERQSHVRNHSTPQVGVPSSASSLPNPTYESFWQSHSASQNYHPQNMASQTPSLAPPANILPRPARPPSLSPRDQEMESPTPPDGLYHFQQPRHSYSLSGRTPTTPPSQAPKRVPLAKMRTPSQQAAVEKDAVETLLFMSSPGNSQAYSSSYNVSTNPTQAAATATIRSKNSHLESTYDSRTSVGKADHSLLRQSPNTSSRARDNIDRKRRPLDEHTIDNILDEMPESDSSSNGSFISHR